MTFRSSQYLTFTPFHSLTVETRYWLLLLSEWFPQSRVMELDKAHELMTLFGDAVDSRSVFRELVDAKFAVLGKTSKGKWALGLVDWFGGALFPSSFSVVKSAALPEPWGSESSVWAKQDLVSKKASIIVDKEIVDSLFAVWRDLYRTPRYKIKKGERRILTEALVAYSPEYVKKAIIGMQYSQWHMGDNPGHIKYTKLTHVVRNLETFAQLYDSTGGV